MVTFQGICLGACNLCKPVIQRPLDLFLIHLGELFHARVRPKPSFAKLPGMIHAIHEWDYLWATVSSFVFTSLQDWPLLVSTLCSGCGRSHCQNHDTDSNTRFLNVWPAAVWQLEIPLWAAFALQIATNLQPQNWQLHIEAINEKQHASNNMFKTPACPERNLKGEP